MTATKRHFYLTYKTQELWLNILNFIKLKRDNFFRNFLIFTMLFRPWLTLLLGLPQFIKLSKKYFIHVSTALTVHCYRHISKIKKEKEKMFIQMKNICYYNVYIQKLKLNKIFQLKYNSDISCRKGEYVHKANFWYKIESTLIVRYTHSGYGLDVITRNT